MKNYKRNIFACVLTLCVSHPCCVGRVHAQMPMPWFLPPTMWPYFLAMDSCCLQRGFGRHSVEQNIFPDPQTFLVLYFSVLKKFVIIPKVISFFFLIELTSAVKMMMVFLNIPASFSALVTFPTASSIAETMP